MRKFVKWNANVLKEQREKVLHVVNSSKCQFVLAVQVFAVCVCVTQKGLDYFVITLRIDQLQAYKNS